MTTKKANVKKTVQKGDVKMNRHEAAAYIDSTYGTMSVWVSTGKYKHLAPFKENGRVYYWQSNLDLHLAMPLKNSRA